MARQVINNGESGSSVRGKINNMTDEVYNTLIPAKVSVSGSELHATATGTNTYAATLTPAPAYASGLTIRIKFTNANTGAATINLNSLGAKAIKKNVSVDLASGDIPAGSIVEMVYDGTNFQAIGILTAVGATWGSIGGTLSAQSDLASALSGKETAGAAATALTSANGYTDAQIATEVTNRNAAITSALEGLKWKQSVKAATTVNGTLATAYENGDTIDGVTLATGDRILLKNQTTQTENGIYVVNASGAPTRAADANTAIELEGAAVTVQQGTSNANTTWNQTTDNITLGSSNIVWGQFGSSVPNADASTRGIAKLYAVPGSNTDGSMDQNSITTALGLKVNKTGFVALTDGATVTWDTSNGLGAGFGEQTPLATIIFGGTARTLAMTNLKDGASGLLIASTGAIATAITITFPANSFTDAGPLTTYTLPVGAGVKYDLSFYYIAATPAIKWIIGVSNIDTDGTLAANSDLLVASQKAGKTYADNINTTLTGEQDRMAWKVAADAATTAALPACTYNAGLFTLTANANGALPAQDGVAAGPTTLYKLLVWKQADQKQNNLFIVLDYGSVSTPWILKVDARCQVNMDGAAVRVKGGTLYGGRTFFQQTKDPTIGTSNLVWKIDIDGMVPSTGTAVKFDLDRKYGFVTAETGNITLDTTDFVEGITQFMRHNSGSVPSFGSEFEVISGSYTISVNNLLAFYAISSTKIFVTILPIA